MSILGLPFPDLPTFFAELNPYEWTAFVLFAAFTVGFFVWMAWLAVRK